MIIVTAVLVDKAKELRWCRTAIEAESGGLGGAHGWALVRQSFFEYISEEERRGPITGRGVHRLQMRRRRRFHG
jgi:hypothetical protein